MGSGNLLLFVPSGGPGTARTARSAHPAGTCATDASCWRRIHGRSSSGRCAAKDPGQTGSRPLTSRPQTEGRILRSPPFHMHFTGTSDRRVSEQARSPACPPRPPDPDRRDPVHTADLRPGLAGPRATGQAYLPERSMTVSDSAAVTGQGDLLLPGTGKEQRLRVQRRCSPLCRQAVFSRCRPVNGIIACRNTAPSGA